MLITSRCSGVFDRHRLDDQNYQFLDMFDHSIGVVTDRESRLFSRFNRASAQSAKWLQRHQRRRMSRSALIGPPSSDYEHGDEHSADQFPDALLDIGVETSLLAEIKDIRDELNIIMGIFDAQLQTVTYLEGYVTEELRGEGPRRTTDPVVSVIRRRAGEQKRNLDARQKDISRMDNQAESLYRSLTDLLDLKQKHSNALEARFAGDQAIIAAKQGQTIMVFTIVTIVFLPLSFIASFFAINFQEWSETTPLTISYVSRYLFGIGLAISIPLVALAFTVQDITTGAINLFSRVRSVFGLPASQEGGPSPARIKKGSTTQHNGIEVDLPGMKPAVTYEKGDIPKPSLSSRREDYYQQHNNRPGDWDGNLYSLSRNGIRSSYHSRECSGEGAARRRLSPVSAAERRRKASLGSGHGNTVTWAARPSLDGTTGIAGVAWSGPRPRGWSGDLERGRF
jgi:Mg2+ and Co2+ transporter CorA